MIPLDNLVNAIISPHLECLTYTVARRLSYNSKTVYILTRPLEEVEHYSHKFYHEKIATLKQVCFIYKLDLNSIEYIDNAFFFLSPELQYIDWKKLIHLSKQISILSNCSYNSYSYPKFWLQEVKELIKYPQILFNSKKAFFLNNFYQTDIYSLWMKKYHFGFDIHSNFFTDNKLYEQIIRDDWHPDEIRSYRLNFIGNRSPNKREQILNIIKHCLAVDYSINLEHQQIVKNIIWVEYGDSPNEVRGVAAEVYIGYLSKSDFTLCPSGYISVTHRVLEAILRGSIPVLNMNELSLYDIELQNGVNCIAVINEDWEETIHHIMSINIDTIASMRKNLLKIKDLILEDAATFSRKIISYNEAQNI